MSKKFKKRNWYAYLYGNPFIPESYHLIPNRPWCSNGKNLCAIYTKGYAEQPEEFSDEIKNSIAIALASGIPHPPGLTSVVLLK